MVDQSQLKHPRGERNHEASVEHALPVALTRSVVAMQLFILCALIGASHKLAAHLMESEVSVS